MSKLRHEIDGRFWIPISRAAKLLGTNAHGIRKLMSEDKLDWRQPRLNAQRFVVDEAGVMSIRKELPLKLKRSPDPLARPRNPMPERRVRGGLWEAHQLRVTLPQPEELDRKKRR